MDTSQNQPTAQPTGVLLRKNIIDLGIICENAKEECFKPSSYDLRIGSEYLNTDGEQSAVQVALHDSTIVVPPLGSVIVSTHEVVEIPKNVIGKFNLRIKLAVQGLFVQMGTQVEPHYRGRLFAVLHNVSADPIELKLDGEGDQRERLFTIEFFFTIGEAEEPTDAKEYYCLQDFISNLSFTKSPMSTLLESSNAAESKLAEANSVLKGAKDELADIAQENIEVAKSDLKKWTVSEVSKSVEKELKEQSKGWRKFAIEFGIIGMIVVAISAMLPVVFSIAMELAQMGILSVGERTIGSRISVIETGLEELRDALNGNERLQALSARLEEVNATVKALELESADMRREIAEASRMSYTGNQNPGEGPAEEQ